MKKHPPFNRFCGPSGRPTRAEIELIEASSRGIAASCGDFPVRQRKVSAELIALLATEKFAHPDFSNWSLHENGLHLEMAALDGALNLEGKAIQSSLRLEGCILPEGFDLDGATIGGDLSFHASEITGTSYLCDAKVNGQVSFHQVTINRNSDGPSDTESELDALVAYGLQAHSFVLNEAEVIGHVDLLNAHFAGQFNAVGAKVSNANGTALSMQNIIASAVSFDQSHITGRLLIQEARIEGQLSALAATFEGADDLAIEASGSRVDAWNMNLADVTGEITMIGVDVSGQLQANGININNAVGDAIRADYARIGSGIFFKPMSGPDGRRVAHINGCINLSFSNIEKIMDFSEAKLTANEHVTLGLRGAVINGEVVMRKAVFVGHILADAIRMEGRFSFRGTELSASPKSLIESSKTEKNNKELRKHFRHHALVLREAKISGRLVLPDVSPNGIVDLSRANCDILEDYSEGWSPELPIHEGLEEANDDKLPRDHTVLDGFEYNYLENPSGGDSYGEDIWKKRVRWLSSQSAQDLNVHFNPQPWRQAAEVLRRMGYEDAAQKVTIRGRVRQRRAKDTTFIQRLVSRILHYTASYGFNPWKTVGISAFIMVLFAGLFFLGHQACIPGSVVSQSIGSQCHSGDLFVQPGFGDFNDATVASEYPSFSAFYYSIDIFIPLLDFGEERYWLPNSRTIMTFETMDVLPFASLPIGSLTYFLIFLERIIGAVLMAIAITGFTGLLARNES